ncbi:MAG: metalloregulator ArsR/SmtB family transcription factor [Pseudomonadota bacterium]
MNIQEDKYKSAIADQLEPRIEEAARLMDMLSQPIRLRILCALLEGEWSVVRLAGYAKIAQPTMSHHLRKLREASLVETRRDAQTIYYSLRGDEVRAVLAVLKDLYCPDGFDSVGEA